MGQQASDAKEAVRQPSSTASSHSSSCCAGRSHPSRSDRSLDTVVVNGVACAEEAGADGAEVTEPCLEKKKSKFPRQPVDKGVDSGPMFRCGVGRLPGPEVELGQVFPTSASISWTCHTEVVRAFHVYVYRLPANSGCDDETAVDASPPKDEGGTEGVAFFEALGSETSFVLPTGTLERASGRYIVEVVAESGRIERPMLSSAGVCQPFTTPAEPPQSVTALRLSSGGVSEHSISIEWEETLDTGGVLVDSYEVQLLAEDNTAEAEIIRGDTVQERFYVFDGLKPGSGPFSAQVRACNVAGLSGPWATVSASTVVGAPSPVFSLTARLLPARQCVNGEAGSVRDADTVRLEFRAPRDDGGRELQNYRIYATPCVLDEVDLSSGSAVTPVKGIEFVQTVSGVVTKPLLVVPAREVTENGELEAGTRCICNVDLAPNNVYGFAVEAWNGFRASNTLGSTPSVFVPARVPMPPDPPRIVQREGGFVAELRWEALLRGGGLPLLSFKIGVIGGRGNLASSRDVQREINVSVADAALAGCWEGDDEDAEAVEEAAEFEDSRQATRSSAWGVGHSSTDRQASKVRCAARVENLDADASYRFILAASNLVGTGRWSARSSPIQTPVAAPATPVNAVATVAPDTQQKHRVCLTVSWECGQDCPGTGEITCFYVTLRPSSSSPTMSGSSVGCRQDAGVVRERIANGPSGQRLKWSSALSAPGRYQVDIVAETINSIQSLPAHLSVDVGPEAFPPSASDVPPAVPRWAEEPLLVLGSAAAEAKPVAALANDVEGQTGKWLQVMLLWHDRASDSPKSASASAGTAPPPATAVDVVCFYRSSTTGQSRVVALATSVRESRMQGVLPTHVPLSVRLVARMESTDAQTKHRVQSEPLLLMLSEGSEQLKPLWEVWSRDSTDGTPPHWVPLSEALQTNIEAAWLEGQPKLPFELPLKGALAACAVSDDSANESPCAQLDPGRYEIHFGDERRVQHSVRRIGLSIVAWQANARRVVRTGDGEDVALPPVPSEESCVICMERRRTHAFMHSDTGDGHLAVCGPCAEAFRPEMSSSFGVPRTGVRTCPMCRLPFSALQRIYS
eukprot:TRINITY_DN48654_c0_g1_i1.p1 TRINITY_DN48654_c0_g1~~TRINITY_DN48654_c0_g1_i1.p1  ORF type:complete len:1084 (+),score=161.13 TRINITY_DN48654_c0_g1_i1:116-3367(+)